MQSVWCSVYWSSTCHSVCPACACDLHCDTVDMKPLQNLLFIYQPDLIFPVWGPRAVPREHLLSCGIREWCLRLCLAFLIVNLLPFVKHVEVERLAEAPLVQMWLHIHCSLPAGMLLLCTGAISNTQGNEHSETGALESGHLANDEEENGMEQCHLRLGQFSKDAMKAILL